MEDELNSNLDGYFEIDVAASENKHFEGLRDGLTKNERDKHQLYKDINRDLKVEGKFCRDENGKNFSDPIENEVLDDKLKKLTDDPKIIKALHENYAQELTTFATYSLFSSIFVDVEQGENPVPGIEKNDWDLHKNVRDNTIYLSGITTLKGLIQLAPKPEDDNTTYKHNFQSKIACSYRFDTETNKFVLHSVHTSNSLLQKLLSEKSHTITDKEVKEAKKEEAKRLKYELKNSKKNEISEVRKRKILKNAVIKSNRIKMKWQNFIAVKKSLLPKESRTADFLDMLEGMFLGILFSHMKHKIRTDERLLSKNLLKSFFSLAATVANLAALPETQEFRSRDMAKYRKAVHEFHKDSMKYIKNLEPVAAKKANDKFSRVIATSTVVFIDKSISNLKLQQKEINASNPGTFNVDDGRDRLIQNLNQQADNYFSKKIIETEKTKSFYEKFEKTITEEEIEFEIPRKSWKPYLLMAVCSLAGVGLLPVVAEAIYKKATRMSFLLFGDKRPKTEKKNEIPIKNEESINTVMKL